MTSVDVARPWIASLRSQRRPPSIGSAHASGHTIAAPRAAPPGAWPKPHAAGVTRDAAKPERNVAKAGFPASRGRRGRPRPLRPILHPVSVTRGARIYAKSCGLPCGTPGASERAFVARPLLVKGAVDLRTAQDRVGLWPERPGHFLRRPPPGPSRGPSSPAPEAAAADGRRRPRPAAADPAADRTDAPRRVTVHRGRRGEERAPNASGRGAGRPGPAHCRMASHRAPWRRSRPEPRPPGLDRAGRPGPPAPGGDPDQADRQGAVA